jgi:hypothetical protein
MRETELDLVVFLGDYSPLQFSIGCLWLVLGEVAARRQRKQLLSVVGIFADPRVEVTLL